MKALLPGIWRKKYLGNKTSLFVTSILIGLLTALCAVMLKNGVHFIQHVVHELSVGNRLHYLLFVFPTVGILLTVIFTRTVLRGDLGRGVNNIIFTISRRASVVERSKLYSQMLTSILTVGFGGSAGLEAPIASTGAAIGSQTARWLLFDSKERTLLLACGAAAGISAIFNAPIAGVVFAFEILLVDMPLLVGVPLLIASASAYILSHRIYSGQPFVLITEAWNSEHLVYYLLFSLVAAFLSVYAIRIYYFIGDRFLAHSRPYRNALIGGSLLGLVIFLLPPLYGEGYESVLSLMHTDANALLKDCLFVPDAGKWTVVAFTATLMLVKVIATSFTVGAGGNGGMFGSSVFTGAMCGFTFAHAVNLTGITQLNEMSFTVVGMAALMSGVIHAPLTAIFMIAEITGGYTLFVPLMIVSSVTYLVTRYFEPYSVYTKKLAQQGDLIDTDKDKKVLSKISVGSIIEKDFIQLRESDVLADLVNAIEHSRRNIFPVVGEDGNLKGVVLLDNVRKLIFARELYSEKRISELMVPPPAVIDIGEEMDDVLEKFDSANAWNLPVTENGRYAGFISKSRIFTLYRKHLIRESVLPA